VQPPTGENVFPPPNVFSPSRPAGCNQSVRLDDWHLGCGCNMNRNANGLREPRRRVAVEGCRQADSPSHQVWRPRRRQPTTAVRANTAVSLAEFAKVCNAQMPLASLCMRAVTRCYQATGGTSPGMCERRCVRLHACKPTCFC
jgi:hypothetical protein